MDDLIEKLRQYAQADDLHKDERDTLIAAADALEAAREDVARVDWLSQFDVGIWHLCYGDYRWYTYANPMPEHGMLGLREAIDAAREARNG